MRAQLELQTQLTRSPESVRPPLRMPKHGHCSRGKLSVNLRDAEYATGHYREAIEPYRQALALIDRDKDLLDWCAAATKLQTTLWKQGQDSEADPLAWKFGTSTAFRFPRCVPPWTTSESTRVQIEEAVLRRT